MQAGSNPGALIVHLIVGPGIAQGFALVPLNHNSQGFEIIKRQIHRPFSVAEIHAVENLGTGKYVALHALYRRKNINAYGFQLYICMHFPSILLASCIYFHSLKVA